MKKMGGFGMGKEGRCDGISTCWFSFFLTINCLSRNSVGTNYRQLTMHLRKIIGMQNAMAHSNLKNVLAPWVSIQWALPCCSLASFKVLSAPLFHSLMLIAVFFYKPLFKIKYARALSSLAGLNYCVCIFSALPVMLEIKELDFNQVCC